MSDTSNPSTADRPAHVVLRGGLRVGLVFARHTHKYPIGYMPKPHKGNVLRASR